jgi:hypothetical protein
MAKETNLEKKLSRIIFEARYNSQWTDVVNMDIAKKSYELGQKELFIQESKRDLLIDFCGLIVDNSVKKDMLKQINLFLKTNI